MMTPTYKSRSSHGFTLVELVVAIVISSIVAGFIVLFITTPINAYFAQSRRAELIVESDLIQRNMDHDIRNAVPNSIRIINVGSVKVLELLYAVDMASYRQQGPSGYEQFNTGTADSDFNVLGHFNRITLPFNLPGYYLTVNHTGLPGHDAYTLTNVITALGTSILINSNTTIANENHVHLGGATTFTTDSPNAHVFLVSGPVAYVCDQTAGTLQRFANYSISSTIAGNRNSSATTSIGMISQDISTCNFVDYPSTTYSADLAIVTIQMQRSGETMPVFIQSAVENLP